MGGQMTRHVDIYNSWWWPGLILALWWHRAVPLLPTALEGPPWPRRGFVGVILNRLIFTKIALGSSMKARLKRRARSDAAICWSPVPMRHAAGTRRASMPTCGPMPAGHSTGATAPPKTLGNADWVSSTPACRTAGKGGARSRWRRRAV